MLLTHNSLQVSEAQQYIQAILNIPGYNISRIAKELDVPTSTISNLHKGRARKPNSKLFKRLFVLYLYVVMNQVSGEDD